MRAPSLNYSSLSSAVSDKYNAKSGEFANKSIQIATDSAKIAKESSQLAKENLERNREFEKKQEALNWANVGIQGLQAVNSWLGAAGKISEARQSANAEQSKDSLLDFSTALDAKIKDSVNSGNTFIDDNGNIVMGDEVKSFVDDYINSTDGTKWGAKVKADHNYSAKQIFANSESRAASYLQQKYNSEWYAGYQANLTKAQGIALGAYSFDQLQSGQITPEMRYAAGYAVIDSEVSSGKLSAQEAAIHKAQYVRAVDNATGQTVMSQVARQGGDRNAVAEWLKSNYGLTDQEINQINDIADASEQDFMKKTLIPAAEKAIDDAFATYGNVDAVTPEQAIQSMQQTLREQGQSESHIKEVTAAMQNELIAAATRDLTVMTSGYEQMGIDALTVTYQNVQDKKEFYKGGAESVYQTYVNKLDKQLTSFGEAAANQAKENVDKVKTILTTSQKQNAALVAQVQDGSISGYDAISSIRQESFSMTGSYTGEELQYLKENCPELYDAMLDYDKKTIDLINTIKDQAVPDNYKKVFDSYIKDMEDDLFKLYGKNETVAVEEAKVFLEGSLIDLMLETAKNEIDPSKVEQRLEDMTNIFVADTYKNLTASLDAGVFGSETAGQLAVQQMAQFESNPGAAYFDDDTGNIVWADQKIKQSFDNASYAIRDWLNSEYDLGIETIGTIVKPNTSSPMAQFENNPGAAYPMAQYHSGDSTYEVDSEGNVYILGVLGQRIAISSNDGLITPEVAQVMSKVDFSDPEVIASLEKTIEETKTAKPELPVSIQGIYEQIDKNSEIPVEEQVKTIIEEAESNNQNSSAMPYVPTKQEKVDLSTQKTAVKVGNKYLTIGNYDKNFEASYDKYESKVTDADVAKWEKEFKNSGFSAEEIKQLARIAAVKYEYYYSLYDVDFYDSGILKTDKAAARKDVKNEIETLIKNK